MGAWSANAMTWSGPCSKGGPWQDAALHPTVLGLAETPVSAILGWDPVQKPSSKSGLLEGGL